MRRWSCASSPWDRRAGASASARTGRAPAREGTIVVDAGGRQIGRVTSGGFGPSVGGPIAMGYVEAAQAMPGTALALVVRGAARPAHVVGAALCPAPLSAPPAPPRGRREGPQEEQPMNAPRFTKDHEWVRLDGDLAVIGITDYAQSQLGDVVYVELPEIGRRLEQGKPAAVVELVKAASDVFAPVSGEVAEVNDALAADPAQVNADPMGEGWFLKLRLADPTELDALMDEAAYRAPGRGAALMRYLPLTAADRAAMLKAIGVDSIDALFAEVPPAARLDGLVDLPRGQGEIEVERAIAALASQNLAAGSAPFFLGAGAYRHHVPAAVDHLIQRGEFLTSYTPYQPEIAQGTLQYLFEFQTQVALLTGMEVANASLYDGATACAEAVMMANRLTGRKRAVLSGGLHPHYREVCETYGHFVGFDLAAPPPAPGTEEQLARLHR